MQETPSIPLPGEGDEVAGWRLGGMLGRGAQGTVFRASRVDDPLPYAAKVVSLVGMTEAGRQRLRRESTLTSRMSHPGIVTVHQVVERSDWVAIVMDEAIGQPADRLCDGTLGWELSLRVIVAAARALDYAHRRNGLIHRDIKPANLIVHRAGANLLGVKVVDFGLGRDRSAGEAGLTMTGEIMGTPWYMSPEQASSERRLTFATDVYALGASLFHLIAGRPPFTGRSAIEILARHLKDEPPVLRQVAVGCPVQVSDLVGWCLIKDPGKRFRSYRTFLAMAEPILGGNPFDGPDLPVTGGSTAIHAADGTTRSAWRRPQGEATPASASGWHRPVHEEAEHPPEPRRPTTRWLFPAVRQTATVEPPAADEAPTVGTDHLPTEAELTLGPAPDTRPPKPSLADGTAIDEHFVVLRPLGAGAMGEVYEVEDRFIGRRLAMKILSMADMARPAAVARFKCEAAALASVGHPAFPYLAGGGSWHGRDYLYMELVRGIDLRAWLQRSGGRIPERSALLITGQLVQAMDAAYRTCGMVHRDLKPANIMIAEHHDGSPQARIVDFGVSVYIDYGDWDDYSARTYNYIDDGNEGRVVGTPAYMSPEQVQAGPPSPLMDMYAIGAILCQMLSGRTPFTAPGVPALLMKILHEAPPDLEDVSGLAPATRQLVRRLLAKQPERRFKSWAQCAAAVTAALHCVRGAER